MYRGIVLDPTLEARCKNPHPDPPPCSPRGREKRILAQDTAAFFASARYFPSGGRVDARVGVASGWMRGGSVD